MVLGDERTRAFYALLVGVAVVALVAVAVTTTWLALLGLVFALPGAAGDPRSCSAARPAADLVPVLQRTGRRGAALRARGASWACSRHVR